MRKIICFFLLCTPLYVFANNNHLSVVLDWFINPDHAPIFVAEQHGFFKQQGLDVQILPLTNPSDGPKYVAAQKADVALTYEPQLLLEQKKGLPLEQFGTLVNQPLDCVSVRASSPIQSMRDLAGKKIGTSDGAVDHLLLARMLADHQLALKEVDLINVRYNLTTALLSKKIEAASGFMRNVEPIEMKLLGTPTRNFYPEDNGVPPYAELIWVRHINLTPDKKVKFEKFITALKKATKYLKQHPEQTWLEFAKSNPTLNNEFNHESWMATVPLFDESPGVLDVKQTARFRGFVAIALSETK